MIVRHERQPQLEAENIAAYWTPERLAKARPEPLLERRTAAPPAPPAPPALLEAAAPVADPTAVPFRSIGKLYYSRGTHDFWCSAAAINRNGLLTAAHCLYDVASAQWSSKLLFKPAYTSGTMPFGEWAYQNSAVNINWIQTGDFAFDVGCVVLQAGGNGKQPVAIGDAVGILDFAVNRTPDHLTWNDVGYPQNYGDGNVMYQEPGAFASRPEVNEIGKVGTFTFGASGSPWLLSDKPGTTNGVQSYIDSSYPNQVFSPFFSDWVQELIEGSFP